MASNYDSSQPGVLYSRIPRIVIEYPIGQPPTAYIEQTQSVMLNDGSVVNAGPLPPINVTIDPTQMATTNINLVDLNTGATTGTTTVMAVLLGILAVARDAQLKADALNAASTSPAAPGAVTSVTVP